eukprot:INCI16314.11.p1 GENE.INCI16314.11~~INCI16314.11.p1  ORF type:complete len:1054 (+),score=186.10 INCI16314.11:95-3256(+)
MEGPGGGGQTTQQTTGTLDTPLASLQTRYNAVVRQLQEEREKETVMRAKLKAHVEQQQFIASQRKQSEHQRSNASETTGGERENSGGRTQSNLRITNNNRSGRNSPEKDLKAHAWPLRLRSSADSSKASLAALAAYVEQLEVQAAAFRRAGGGGGDGVAEHSTAFAAAAAEASAVGSGSLHPLDYSDINRELKRHVVVTFLGTSSLQVPVTETTTFADVLEESLRYFSLPPTGALLMDLQNCAWPLSKRVIDFYANDLTPPFVKLFQRRRAIVPFDTADLFEHTGMGGANEGNDDLADAEAERQNLLETRHDSSAARRGGGRGGKGAQRTDSMQRCGFILVALQLLQVVAFVSLALLFNPVGRIASVRRVVEAVLFSEAAFSASASTAGVLESFKSITSESDFWLWVQGPLGDRFANNSLVAPSYQSICSSSGASGLTAYHGDNFTGHYCASTNTTTALDICTGAFTDACQIMRGEYTCPVWESLPICGASFGAFALNDFNVIMGPARLEQHRVELSACAVSLLNPRREYMGGTTAPSSVPTTPSTPFTATASTTTTTTLTGTSTTTTTTSTTGKVSVCAGPLADANQATGPRTAPRGVSVTNGTFPDADAWETCFVSDGRNSKLDSYLYELGVGRMPAETVCSLAINLYPSSSWFTAAVTELSQYGWIDEYTRSIELLFNLYNPTLDIAATVAVKCANMASGGFACEHVVQGMPVVMPLTQYSATQSALEFWWLTRSNWTVFALLLLFTLLNACAVGAECFFICKVGSRRYFGLRGFSSAEHSQGFGRGDDVKDQHRMTRVTSTVLSGQCCNVFTWVVEFLLIVAVAVKIAVWTDLGQVFMLESSTTHPQLRFSQEWADTYDFNDVGSQQMLFQASSLLDAVCVWALLMLALKYFHVNVFNSFLVRAVSLAFDGLFNAGLVLAIFLGTLFVWHYFLFAKTSLLFTNPDYSFLEMLTSSPHSLSSTNLQDLEAVGASVGASLEVQVFSILFALTFTMFVLLIMIPLLTSILVGVVVKLAELVGTEGYYWLTPPHLILAKRQQRNEYSRIFSSS